jgi:hypothetical protein
MKILFLDIDGVLTNEYTRNADTFEWVLCWDVTASILLRDFVNKNNIMIVVSSDWRFDMELTKCCLIAIGIKPQLILTHTDLYTNSNLTGAERRNIEILECVDKLKPTHWVAIDDLPLHINDKMTDHFVETSDDVGLTESHIKEMARILGVEE